MQSEDTDRAEAFADMVEAVVKAALAPVVAKLRALEAGATEVGAVRLELATLRGRVGEPGPPGPAGADGLGFEDYRLAYDGERTIVHTWTRGDRVESFAVTLPAMIYRGVHVAGKTYERGDVVTLAGSLWHCNVETAARPGDGGPGWTLAVKRGRDGKP